MIISKSIHITMKYGKDKNEKIISGLKRISNPVCVFMVQKKLPKVLGGLGIAIISTNKGVLTDKDARKRERWRRSISFRLVIKQLTP